MSSESPSYNEPPEPQDKGNKEDLGKKFRESKRPTKGKRYPRPAPKLEDDDESPTVSEISHLPYPKRLATIKGRSSSSGTLFSFFFPVGHPEVDRPRTMDCV